MTRLILYNIEYLQGNKGGKLEYLKFWRRVDHPKWLKVKLANALRKHRPDIVSFLEVGGSSFMEDNYFDYFKKKLEMKYSVKRLKYKFTGGLSFLKKIPLLNDQTNGILSKKKISEPEVIYFKKGVKKAVIKVEVHVPQKVTLLLAHLALGETVRKGQIDELIKIVKGIKGPVILAGDFNTFGGEEEIKSLLKKAALNHEFKLHGGRTFTYPTKHPRRRLDYVLTSKDINVKKYDVLKMDFSDHLPVLVNFSVRK